MKPHELDAKIFRTVRLQNTAGTNPWNITISTIFPNVVPAFQKIQLVSCTIYGPAVVGMPQILTYNETDDSVFTLSSELVCTPAIGFTISDTATIISKGPTKLVAPGAGRRDHPWLGQANHLFGPCG